MVPVVTVTASDGCGSNVNCRIVDVTSNEPAQGPSPDWQITAIHALLRAERRAGTGRVYTITVACTDPSGNTTTSTVTVTVPR